MDTIDIGFGQLQPYLSNVLYVFSTKLPIAYLENKKNQAILNLKKKDILKYF